MLKLSNRHNTTPRKFFSSSHKDGIPPVTLLYVEKRKRLRFGDFFLFPENILSLRDKIEQ